MSSLTIKNLNKIYNPGKNEVHAVKDFNLEIEDGEFVALLGPSGCGKTSTLRMIVGLESITSGSILFDAVEINHLSPEQRNVAMAFESYALYPNFTIFENLAFPLEVKKRSTHEKQEHRSMPHSVLVQVQRGLRSKPRALRVLPRRARCWHVDAPPLRGDARDVPAGLPLRRAAAALPGAH